MSNYMNIMLFGLGFNINGVLTFQPHTPSWKYPININRDNKELLSLRTFKHSEFLHRTEYPMLNFKSNLGTYEHNWHMNATQEGTKG